MKGYIHIYEGNGKGKSTAAIGLSIRCAGNGGKIIYTQFLKNNKSSELNILKNISNIQVVPSEKEFGFTWNLSGDQKKDAKRICKKLLEQVIDMASNQDCSMLVLDEIIATYNSELINQQDLLEFLKTKPEHLEVVMTGRNPSKELVELADYISEIKKVKHPFDKGIKARVGIEK
jgi:cob(I)alamin adenosyltransferase